MKKILILMCVMAAVLTSCEGPAGPMGPAGEDGEALNWKILTYTVHQNDWQLDGNADALNSRYIYEFDESALTQFIYEEGVVSGYMEQTLNNNVNVLTPLPYVIPVGEENGGNEDLWSEYYTFDYTTGSIAFYAYFTDFYTSNKPPTCTFRIVLNW